MPLPPLPPNTTGRTWFRYTTGIAGTSQEHEVMWRYGAGGSPDDAQESFLIFLISLGAASFRAGWKVLGVRHSEPGSIVSLPRPLLSDLGDFEGTDTDGGYTLRWEAVELSFQGRSQFSGRKVDFSLYTARGEADSTFRAPMGDGILSALNAASSAQALVTIDGTRPVWYPYVNYNYNSYWERTLRS